MLKYYKNLLHKRPYLIQSIQTASLMGLGDVLSQSVFENKNHAQINGYRLAKFGSIGLILGPILTKWYRVLDKINSNSIKVALFKKIALDQLIFAPLALICITTLVALIDGNNNKEIKNKLKRDYLHVLLANYKVWPFVQYINFSIVPLDYRVLVTQSVAVGWNTYLSWKLNAD